jgi:adenylate kinase
VNRAKPRRLDLTKETLLDVVLFGAPGCGKGTQASRLKAFRHISTGDLFRAAVANKTPIGVEIETLMGTGALMPNDITIRLVEEIVAGSPIVWDGFPRTVDQAITLDRLLVTHGRALGPVINLTVPEDVLLERVTARFATSGRSDDNPEIFAVRLAAYHEQTAPVLDYYSDRVITLDGTAPMDDVAQRINGIIQVASILK